MAEFCHDCSIKMFGDDYGDFAKLCGEGMCISVLCEGCGPIHVDRNGKRLDFTELARNYKGPKEDRNGK